MKLITLIYDCIKKFFRDECFTLSAALSFYIILSVIPFFALFIIIAGIFIDSSFITNFLIDSIGGFINSGIAEILKTILISSEDYERSVSILGIILLFIGASAMINSIHLGLNHVWEIKQKRLATKTKKIKKISRNKLRSAAIVLGGAVFLLLFSLISVLINLFNFYLNIFALNLVLWLIFMTFIFSFIFKFVPENHPKFKHVLVGSFSTAILFILGQLVISSYFETAAGNLIGIFRSLIIFILWIYYSSVIFYFGAELTYLMIKNKSVGLRR